MWVMLIMTTFASITITCGYNTALAPIFDFETLFKWLFQFFLNKAESRPIDASSESPRVTQSHSVTQELPRGTQSHPELLRGTPEQSGNGWTDGRTDGPMDRRTDGHTHLQRCEDAFKNDLTLREGVNMTPSDSTTA